MLYDESGISLGTEAIAGGLRVSRNGFGISQLDGFASYYDYVTQDNSGEEFTRMLDLLSTNKTDFSVNPNISTSLRERILPSSRRDKADPHLSSACSTGEEPYTIAMTLYESVRAPEQWNFQVLASDISTRVLAHAAKGLYAEERVREVPPEIIKRHFLHGAETQCRARQGEAASFFDHYISTFESDGRPLPHQGTTRSDFLSKRDDLPIARHRNGW